MTLIPKDCSIKTKSRRISRRGWAEKSAAAMRREETAVKMFETARLKMEARDDLSVGSRETVQLLKPSCHLTEACWKSFRGHVCSVEGWSTKRRVATEAEKKKHGETRKGRVYFVDVIYSVPHHSKERESSYKERNKENINPDNQKQFQDKNKAGPSLSPPPVSPSVQSSKFFKRLSSTLPSASSILSPASSFLSPASSILSPASSSLPSVSSTLSSASSILSPASSILSPASSSLPSVSSTLSSASSILSPVSSILSPVSSDQSPPSVSPSVKSSKFFKRLSCTLSPDSPVSSTVSISPAPLFPQSSRFPFLVPLCSSSPIYQEIEGM
ncbi:DNA-directed RNA polymerase II subunit RPB1-like [Bolinopsis microptera]|uniref:DNA-directed RNA polymerase II subunit RPB1-like n=1 Tax=Bolinopsis microptera TaxID=2820187 RepID=UPI00307A4998